MCLCKIKNVQNLLTALKNRFVHEEMNMIKYWYIFSSLWWFLIKHLTFFNNEMSVRFCRFRLRLFQQVLIQMFVKISVLRLLFYMKQVKYLQYTRLIRHESIIKRIWYMFMRCANFDVRFKMFIYSGIVRDLNIRCNLLLCTICAFQISFIALCFVCC